MINVFIRKLLQISNKKINLFIIYCIRKPYRTYMQNIRIYKILVKILKWDKISKLLTMIKLNFNKEFLSLPIKILPLWMLNFQWPEISKNCNTSKTTVEYRKFQILTMSIFIISFRKILNFIYQLKDSTNLNKNNWNIYNSILLNCLNYIPISTHYSPRLFHFNAFCVS